jgi:hypothetical protein
MRGTKAKRLRRDRVAQGLPAFAVPVHNFTDREDTHRDRRLKKCHPKEYARQLRETDPRTIARKARFWRQVWMYLTAPVEFKPYIDRYPGDTTQEARQQAFEAHLDKGE